MHFPKILHAFLKNRTLFIANRAKVNRFWAFVGIVGNQNKRNMAKKEEQIERLSVQDYLINALDKPVAVKGGGYLKDPTDGHEMTAMEAMSMKVMQNALNGDLKSIQFIMQLEQAHRLQQQRKK